MMKIATLFVCVAVCFCVFNQSVEAAVGLSGYLIAFALSLAAAALASWKSVREAFSARAHSFDRRVTEGGFLN